MFLIRHNNLAREETLEGKRLKEYLKEHFGFDTFKKGQREVISRTVDHQSALAVFPTGAGKSLCYQLSAMLLPNMTLVVSPLISLMKDQLDFLSSHHISAALLNSTLERAEYNKILQKAKDGALKILMISVERFKNERFRIHLEKMKVSLLVVDEAHCISEWGHNFRPEYLKLPFYQREFKIPQALLLTATATGKVVDDMCHKFSIPSENAIVTGFYRSNLFLQVTPTAESEKKVKLLSRISQAPDAPTIVYVTLQKTSEDVARFLCDHGIKASAYHAGMKNDDRTKTQNRFMNGKLPCVVATIAFGMGIDRKDIRRVIHYDLPKSIENYSQEIGRSGRDDQESFCEVLANRDNVTILENFVYGDTPEKTAIHRLVKIIKDHTDTLWEIKLLSLSYEVNIRVLPLRTLLVYLDIEGIISPKYTRFEEYSFKYNTKPSDIAERFRGERRKFVEAIIQHCETKKVWTVVDIGGILKNYDTDRPRIVTALEYFEGQGWIELQAKLVIEAFEIKTREFDSHVLSDRLHDLFKARESHEIDRIHNMIRFFESDSCISKNLAEYFGDRLKTDRCGHCFFCADGPKSIPHITELQPLSAFDFAGLTADFMATTGEGVSVTDLAKFLCGISTPRFVKRKSKRLPQFGALERYPFSQVKAWIMDSWKK
jgi:ATP-dependent DNA helicase RecQ